MELHYETMRTGNGARAVRGKKKKVYNNRKGIDMIVTWNPKQRFGWLWARAAPLPYAVYMGIYNTKWLSVHY